jgi:hypothetical protein
VEVVYGLITDYFTTQPQHKRAKLLDIFSYERVVCTQVGYLNGYVWVVSGNKYLCAIYCPLNSFLTELMMSLLLNISLAESITLGPGLPSARLSIP